MDIGYIRCSTDHQDLEAQRQMMRDAGVEQIFEDYAKSGAKLGRSGLDKALAACREGDRITVVRIDRLSRSMQDFVNILADLTARGVTFRSITQGFDTSTPEGRLMANMLASFSEFEREMIKARTKDAMRVAKARGKLKGKRPKLSAVQQESLYKQYLSGEYTITELAEIHHVTRPTVYRTIDRMKHQAEVVRKDVA